MNRLRPLVETLGTFLAGLAGGAVFDALNLPVPWLAGPMVVVAGLAMANAPILLPGSLKDFGFLIAGLSLGSTVTTEALATLQRYPLSVVGLLLSLVATVAISMVILERDFGWDRPTAFLAGVPGALSMVMALAAENSGDIRKVAVCQSIRLFTLVAILPLAISAGVTTVAPPTPAAVSAGELALMLALSLAINTLIARARLANPLFLSGMLIATTLHVAGLIPGALPPLLTTLGMLTIGIFAGARFAGTRPRDIIAIFNPAIVSVLAALMTALIFGVIVHWLTGLDLAAVLVAFAPGGVEAMIMMGAAMGLDTLYVSTHHVLRTVALNLVTPLFAPKRVA